MIPNTDLSDHEAISHQEWLTSADFSGQGEAHTGGCASRAADWLCLAAAPTFAIMALLTGGLGGGTSALLCSAVQDASPLSGMAPMYLLMSAFHSAPWLKLISTRRNGAHRS